MLVTLPGPSYPTLVTLPGPSPRDPPARASAHAQALEPELETWAEPELTPRPSHKAGGRELTPEPPMDDGDFGPSEGQASPPENPEVGPEPELPMMPEPPPAAGDSGPREGQASPLESPEVGMQPDSPAHSAVPEMGPSEDHHHRVADGRSLATDQPGLGRDADGRLLVTMGINEDGSRTWDPLIDLEQLPTLGPLGYQYRLPEEEEQQQQQQPCQVMVAQHHPPNHVHYT